MTYADPAVLARTVPSDAELITAVRVGDTAAFATLYERHVDAARRFACSLSHDRAEAEDLIADTFARVFTLLLDNRGPTETFRTYLLSSLRNIHIDRVRKNSKLAFSDDLSNVDPGVPFVDTAVEEMDRGLAARAFARLPERQQMVLWHTEVEGETPAHIAPMLGMTPNGVAALAYRARERLRQAYLREYLSDAEEDEHTWVLDRLPTRVRGTLPAREEDIVAAHLDGCDHCRALYAELGEVNSGLRALLLPVVLGPAGAAYLTTLPKLAATGMAATVASWFTKVPQSGGMVSAAGVGGALVAAVAAVALGVTSPSDPPISPRAGLEPRPSLTVLRPTPEPVPSPLASPSPAPTQTPEQEPAPPADEPAPPAPSSAPSLSRPAVVVPSTSEATPTPTPMPTPSASLEPSPTPSPTPTRSPESSPTSPSVSPTEPSPSEPPASTLDVQMEALPTDASGLARIRLTITGIQADNLEIVAVMPDGSAAALVTPEAQWGNCNAVDTGLYCEYVGELSDVVLATLIFAPPPEGGDVFVTVDSGLDSTSNLVTLP